jgi:hypothetical protein
MIISRLYGGLGNQMFQYALGRHLSILHNTTLKFDISFFSEKSYSKNHTPRTFDLDIFNIKNQIATDSELSLFTLNSPFSFANKIYKSINVFRNRYILESKPIFQEDILKLPDNVYLDGYWQSDKYFSAIESIIKNDFHLHGDIPENSQKLSDFINNTNSVAVNVRRGDFITNPTHNVCGLEYYIRAHYLISNKINNPSYFVFSDDIDWCKNNLNFLNPVYYVSHDFAGFKFKEYLRLMSSCKHFIIPNSSFAWWATYLASSSCEIVISPRKWVNNELYKTMDIFRENWICI